MTHRLVHAADLHLDAPLQSLALKDPDLAQRVGIASRLTLEAIVDHCIDVGASALLLAGDVFDREQRSVSTAAFFMNQVDRLGREGIRTFSIDGNHDFEAETPGKYPSAASLHRFPTEGSTCQLEVDGAPRIVLHGASYASRTADGSFLDRYADPVPDALNIALLHTGLDGEHGYAPCSVAQLVAKGYDYWALGHSHDRRVHHRDPWVVMPGTPQGRMIREAGSRSVTEILIEEDRIVDAVEVPTGLVLFERCPVRLSPGQGEDDLPDLVRAAMGAIEAVRSRPGQTLVVRVEIAGESEEATAIRYHRADWHDRFCEMAREFDDLTIEKTDIIVRPPAREGADAGPIGDLETTMRVIREEAGARQELRAILDEALGQLPPAEKRALAPDEAAVEALLDDLSGEAVDHAAALLGAADEGDAR